jgi:ABC-type multidrug transport system fused ATPase/permease subunit
LNSQTHQRLLELLDPASPLRIGSGEDEGDGVTTLIVTSRLETAIAADSVIVLGVSESSNGDGYCEPVVVEQGKPAELLCEEGEFSRLVRESGEEHQLMEAVAESGMSGGDAVDCEL